MNNLRTLTTLLFLLYLAPAASQTNRPDWQAPDASQYANSMTVTAAVRYDGAFTTDADDLVAYFIGGELQGLAELIAIPSFPAEVFHAATVFANGEQDAAVEIRVYHAATDRVFSLDQNLTFNNQATVGNFTTPYELFLASDGPGGVGNGTVRLASVPDQTTLENVDFADVNLADYVTNLSSGNLSFALSEATAGIDFTLVGSTLQATPVAGFTATATVVVTVTESTNGHVDRRTLRYTVRPATQGPELAPIPLQRAAAGGQFDPLDLMDFTTLNGSTAVRYSYVPVLPDAPVADRPVVSQPAGFSNNMTITAVVQYTEGLELGHPDDVLIAYVGDEVRGVATPTEFQGRSYYFLSIATNATPDETYVTRFYDGQRQRLLTYPIELDVVAGEQLGAIGDPYIYDFSAILLMMDATTGQVTATNQDPNQAAELTIEATVADAQFPAINQDTELITFLAEGAALPVELLEFTARRVGKRVTLNWWVGQEEGVAHYGVERASRREGRFVEIGRVAATGRSTYNFSAEDISAGTDVLFRLRVEDQDGTFRYSDLVVVAGQNESVYPNPVRGGDRLWVPGGGHFQLYDQAGRLRASALVSRGGSLQLPELAAGWYLYRNGTNSGWLLVQ